KHQHGWQGQTAAIGAKQLAFTGGDQLFVGKRFSHLLKCSTAARRSYLLLYWGICNSHPSGAVQPGIIKADAHGQPTIPMIRPKTLPQMWQTLRPVCYFPLADYAITQLSALAPA